MKDWGRICVGTRLEKQVDAAFVEAWSRLISMGLRKGDGHLIIRDRVAHVAANELVRQFLKTNADTLFMLDSDADVDPQFLNVFRDYQPGWEYDVLQAFYPRRGWPPEAIWFMKNVLGEVYTAAVHGEDTIADVARIGTHCVLIRREVFVAILGTNDPAEFDWFYYPRHKKMSEDVAFSLDVEAAGFRMGATTHVKAGHITRLTTGWETYQEYMEYSGMNAFIDHYHEVIRQVAEFTGETEDMVQAKAQRGGKNVTAAWSPVSSGVEARAQYGDQKNGYLYDLLFWNFSQDYQRTANPLRSYDHQRVLVVGAGIGGEVERLVGRANQVDVYELPGALRRFCQGRFDGKVNWLPGNSLLESNLGEYDLIVMVDVVEHIHPDEFSQTMDCLADALKTGGAFYIHAPFGQDLYPNEYNHAAAFQAWVERWRLVHESEYLWRK